MEHRVKVLFSCDLTGYRPGRNNAVLSCAGNVAPFARGCLTLHKDINPESLEGLDEYSHVWIIFVFHANNNFHDEATLKVSRYVGSRGRALVSKALHSFIALVSLCVGVCDQAKVRPPRLNGQRVGFFATRCV